MPTSCFWRNAQVANRPGSLADITDVIAKRGINVQSLAVGSSEVPERSRITVVIPRDADGLADIIQKVMSSMQLGCAPAHAACDELFGAAADRTCLRPQTAC